VRAHLGVRRRTALTGAVAAAASLLSCGRSRPGATNASPSPVNEALWVADRSGTVRAYDGRVNRVTAQVQTGLASRVLAPTMIAGGGQIWLYSADGQIAIVDPDRARVTGRASVPAADPPGAIQLAHTGGALWIVQPGGLWRVTPAGRASAIPLPSGFEVHQAAATPRALWLVDGGGALLRVDPGKRTAAPGPRLPAPAALTGGETGLYAVPLNKPRVWLLDPASAVLRSTVEMPRGELVFRVLEAGADQWLVGDAGTVAKVSGGSVSRHAKVSDTSQDFPSAMALGSLWVCDEVDSKVVRVDLARATVTARIGVDAADPDDPAFAVVAGERSVWIVDTNFADGVQRIDPETNQAVRLSASSGSAAGVTAVVAAI
jgi:hypothetical protein